MQQKYYNNYFVAESNNEITIDKDYDDGNNGIRTNIPLNNFLNAQVCFFFFFYNYFYYIYIYFFFFFFFFFFLHLYIYIYFIKSFYLNIIY